MRHRSRRAWDARSGHHHARRHTDGAPRAHQSSSAGGLFETKTATDRFATRQELGGITTHDISFAVGEAPFAQERARCGQTVPTRARDRGFRWATLISRGCPRPTPRVCRKTVSNFAFARVPTPIHRLAEPSRARLGTRAFGGSGDLVPSWPAPRIPGPTQLPTADLALRPLHRAGLVAGPRNGGVRYARLRERLHFTPQGFRGMASPTEGEPISAAQGVF